MTYSVDHFTPLKDTTSPPPLRLVEPTAETDDTIDEEVQATSDTEPERDVQTDNNKRSRPFPWMGWAASVALVVLPLILLVAVLSRQELESSASSPTNPPIEQTASLVTVTQPASTVALTAPKSTKASSRKAATETNRRRRAKPPAKDDWAPPISFDCDQLKTASERLRCAGR